MEYANNQDFAEEIADAIKFLISNESERIQMGLNARRCAEEKFDREKHYQSVFPLIVFFIRLIIIGSIVAMKYSVICSGLSSISSHLAILI